MLQKWNLIGRTIRISGKTDGAANRLAGRCLVVTLWRPKTGISSISVLLLLSMVIQSWNPVAAETESTMQQLRLAMDVAIGHPTAMVQNQCRTVALGVKPCGGPREYLVYSTEVTESQTLHDLVDKYNRCDHDRNERLELMSDCAFVAEPTLVLSDGICRVKIPRSN